jgi:hypothetical protein
MLSSFYHLRPFPIASATVTSLRAHERMEILIGYPFRQSLLTVCSRIQDFTLLEAERIVIS